LRWLPEIIPIRLSGSSSSDEDGTIDRVALRAAIDAPENSEVWIMIEQQLRDNRRQQKMNNFISSGLRVSSLDINNEFKRDNSYADIRYVDFPTAKFLMMKSV
jgi:peptidyl-prolyl cis-trans isomerase D